MTPRLSNGLCLEAEGGAVPLLSPFYLERPGDHEFREAIRRGDSIVLVKGARQMGKTSLLARGLHAAREAGARVVHTDFQTLSPGDLDSMDTLCMALGEMLADQLDLDVTPAEVWEIGRPANANFQRYLCREVLDRVAEPVVWGMDEVDRLFTCPFSDEVFAMLRAWHNKRALEPGEPWSRLTVAISFATEAHLFIRDLNQSPFNVGTRVLLRDFTPEEVGELNRRYGSPLRTDGELRRFYRLLSGHPFLTRRALHELAARTMDLGTLEDTASRDDGPFGDHLRRMLIVLARDPELCAAARAVACGGECPSVESFYRLRSAGVLAGERRDLAEPRSHLYGSYLAAHLA